MDFVNFNLAKKLKEKGFDWDRITTYNTRTKVRNNHIEPTISQVLKWLRDTHKLFIFHCVIDDYQDDFHHCTTYWSFSVQNIESGDYIYKEYARVDENRFDSYEQAAIAGIEYVLDNLI